MDNILQLYNEIYDEYYKKVFAFFRRDFSYEDSEDLVQQVIMMLWQWLANTYAVKNKKSLIFSIAKNVRIDMYRKNMLKFERNELIEELDLQKCVFIEDFKKNILEEAKNYRAFMLTSDYEGLSNSMIEAIAMGMPSICTDCPIGGARMIIEDGQNGFLVPVGDEKALVQKMKKITEMDTCVAVSEKAKKLKEQLDARVIAEQWCEVLFS